MFDEGDAQLTALQAMADERWAKLVSRGIVEPMMPLAQAAQLSGQIRTAAAQGTATVRQEVSVAKGAGWTSYALERGYDTEGGYFIFNDVTEVQAGWPMRCLTGYLRQRGEQPPKYAIPLESDSSSPGWMMVPRRALPLLPLLPGFLVNTLCATPGWWLVVVTIFAGCGSVRRRHRRRRGRCVRCGYILRRTDGRACSECGACEQ